MVNFWNLFEVHGTIYYGLIAVVTFVIATFGVSWIFDSDELHSKVLRGLFLVLSLVNAVFAFESLTPTF